METDIGQPIDYEPNNAVSPPPPPVSDDRDASSTPINVHDGPPATPEEFMYHQALQEQQQYNMYGFDQGPPPPPQVPPPQQNKDLLASVDKITIIVLFAAFIVGFFLGSSRQPVILKYD